MAEGVRFDIRLVDEGGAQPGRPNPSPSPTWRPAAPAPGSAPVPAGAGAAPTPGRSPGSATPSSPQALAGERPGAPTGSSETVSQKVGAMLQKVGEGAKTAAAGLTRLATNDYVGGLRVAADSAASALEKLPVVGPAAAGAIRGLASTVEAASSVVVAFVRRGRDLAGYNPELAAATARADVRSMLADVREAQELGPGMARLTEASSELLNTFREIMLPLKAAVIDGLASLLELLNAGIRDADLTYKQQEIWFRNVSEAALKILAFDMEGYKAAQEKFQKETKELLEEAEKRARERKMKELDLSDILRGLGARFDLPAVRDPVVAGDAAAAVPVAGGR